MTERPLPMLAVTSRPFDSPDYVFEVKWDGVRALAAGAAQGWALWGRAGADYRDRYPELAFLGRLPAGTVLDGELVRGGPSGVPTLAAILHRHQLVHPARVARASRHDPVAYLVFDLLALRGRSLLAEPLHMRRAALHALLQDLNEPALLFSAGVVGAGTVFFAALVAQGHEGMMAKHRASRYRPGRRSAAWRKIKPPRRLPPPHAGGG
jgi:bifunctional non-homologous end joining protein LigD